MPTFRINIRCFVTADADGALNVKLPPRAGKEFLDTKSSVMLDDLFASNHFKNPEIIATSDIPVFNKLSQLNSEIKSINIKHNDSHNIYCFNLWFFLSK